MPPGVPRGEQVELGVRESQVAPAQPGTQGDGGRPELLAPAEAPTQVSSPAQRVRTRRLPSAGGHRQEGLEGARPEPTGAQAGLFAWVRVRGRAPCGGGCQARGRGLTPPRRAATPALSVRAQSSIRKVPQGTEQSSKTFSGVQEYQQPLPPKNFNV